MAGPAIYDLNLVEATGLPIDVVPKKNRYDNKKVTPLLKDEIKKQLRIVDEQNAIRRYTWYNLPKGLSGELIERILYYRGQGIFFRIEELDKYFFLPYTLSGTIDVYGQFTGVRPIPFNGKSEADKDDKHSWISEYQLTPLYDVLLEEDFIDKDGNFNIELAQKTLNESCVIIRDYTQQLSETSIARQILQDPLLDTMSEMIPFCKTALLNSTGIAAMMVQDESDASNVLAASASVNHAALTHQKFIPVVGNLETKDLTDGNVAKAEEFLLAMQSLDNYRLSLYGLDNGGLFQKKSHLLAEEQEMNQGNVGLILDDGLAQRQHSCDIINSAWGLGVWCEVSETVIGIDKNRDGIIGTEFDQSGEEQGNQPVAAEEVE